TALSFPHKGAGCRAVAVQAGRDGLVPGRAAQYGQLVLRRRIPAMDTQPDRCQASHHAICWPSSLGFNGGRSNDEAPGAVEAVRGRGAEVINFSVMVGASPIRVA